MEKRSDPLVYSALVATDDHPICLAYYLSGHFKAIYNAQLPLRSFSNLN